MIPFRLAMVLGLVLALSACATGRNVSFVGPDITPADASVLASDSVVHLRRPLPPSKTTLVITPPRSDPDPLTGVMVGQLKKRGYGVVELDQTKEAKASQGVQFRYLASNLEGGVLLRLQYANREASRYYIRKPNGALASTVPFTVRETPINGN